MNNCTYYLAVAACVRATVDNAWLLMLPLSTWNIMLCKFARIGPFNLMWMLVGTVMSSHSHFLHLTLAASHLLINKDIDPYDIFSSRLAGNIASQSFAALLIFVSGHRNNIFRTSYLINADVIQMRKTQLALALLALVFTTAFADDKPKPESSGSGATNFTKPDPGTFKPGDDSGSGLPPKNTTLDEIMHTMDGALGGISNGTIEQMVGDLLKNATCGKCG